MILKAIVQRFSGRKNARVDLMLKGHNSTVRLQGKWPGFLDQDDGRINLKANLPRANTRIMPTTGTMMVSGGHNPTVSIGKKADNS